ncbi:MAG TPA: branched-chain-amino-acid transaminase, partial [Candidatus Bathyarchaeota archaeon]|nr:branched-chain-amino-acid transaminase [Candidatus Bathyarchaeota archaeon]
MALDVSAVSRLPIEEAKFIWMDGQLVPWHEAKIHILSHVIHYGSGVFEGIRCYKTERGPAIFRLEDHIKRLFYSAKVYMMEIPYSMEELMEACKEVVRANGLDDCYIRPVVYRGYGEMGVNPLKSPVNVAIAAWRWGAYLGEALEKGARVKVSTWRRICGDILPPTAKACGHYMNSQLAKMEAVLGGYDEALMLDINGYVS